MIAVDLGGLRLLLDVVGVVLAFMVEVVREAGYQQEKELLTVDELADFRRQSEGLMRHLRNQKSTKNTEKACEKLWYEVTL